MWRDALLVAGKDLRIEVRSKVALNQVLPFALVILILFGLALDPERTPLAGVAAGLFWVATLFSTMLSVQRSFAIESSDAARDGLRMLGVDPAGIFFGKSSAIFIELIALEVILGVGATFLYHLQLAGIGLLVATLIVATLGLVALGSIYGALTIGQRGKETLLPLLFFPVVAPVVLGATIACNDALDGVPGRGVAWLEVLAVFAAVYLAIGAVVFGPLLEDQ